MMELRLISVNVGMPRTIGTLHGEPVLSGFAKAPLASSTVFVGSTNIDGDGQADLSVHGGVDKAVYCYSADHWPWWERENAFPCRPASFGENLTIEGADETEVAIGDRFRWGEVVLEVSQPRAPCFKFAIYANRPDAPALMTVSGRSGWYFRVSQEGRAPVGPSVLVRESSAGGPNVREAFFAVLHAHTDREILKRVADAPALATSWRSAVARRLRA
jgi:MOSC domain-containing protein YiiM